MPRQKSLFNINSCMCKNITILYCIYFYDDLDMLNYNIQNEWFWKMQSSDYNECFKWYELLYIEYKISIEISLKV